MSIDELNTCFKKITELEEHIAKDVDVMELAQKALTAQTKKIAGLEEDALRLLEIIQSSYLYSNEWNEINEIEKRLKREK